MTKTIEEKILEARKLLCDIKEELNEKPIEYSPDFTIADAISAIDELQNELIHVPF
jgi:hypothetical protein